MKYWITESEIRQKEFEHVVKAFMLANERRRTVVDGEAAWPRPVWRKWRRKHYANFLEWLRTTMNDVMMKKPARQFDEGSFVLCNPFATGAHL